MTEERTLMAHLDGLRTATVLAVGDVVARESGSFLEKTFRDALATRLPRARIEQPLNLDPDLWPGRLGGVDILYVADDGARVGVETKVWDVADSLYDIFKLAAATQSGKLAAGYCAISGRASDWRAPSAIRDMSATATARCVELDVGALLADHQRGWARIWARAAVRPLELPRRLRTLAGEPVAMPHVPDHKVRLVGVQAVGEERVRLDQAGAAAQAGAPSSPRGRRLAEPPLC